MEKNIAGKLSPTEIWMAYDHIERRHQKTPLVPFGEAHRDGFTVYLYAKMDTLNPGGSFKDRGSLYFVEKAIQSGKIERGDTIVAASAGNHAKGVAKAARDYKLNAIIYMSEQTPKKKIKGTRDLGARVNLVEGDYHAAAHEAEEFAEKNRFLYVPAYEHSDIIIGQSTVVTEAMIQLFKQGIRPDFFIFPYGGGGLANGGGYAARRFDSINEFLVEDVRQKIFTYGVQAENFNTMVRSFKDGRLLDFESKGETIADGIRVPHATAQMLELTKLHLDDMFDVTEEEIRSAIRRVYNSDLLSFIQRDKDIMHRLGFHENHINIVQNINVVEGAAASAFACAFSENKVPFEEIARKVHPRKEIVGVVIASGGNIDNNLLEEILKE